MYVRKPNMTKLLESGEVTQPNTLAIAVLIEYAVSSRS